MPADLNKHARLEAEAGVELAESMNDQLTNSSHKFIYVIWDGMYLVEETESDNPDLRFEGTLEDTGHGDMAGASDNVAEELDGLVVVDVPGDYGDRLIYTEMDD